MHDFEVTLFKIMHQLCIKRGSVEDIPNTYNWIKYDQNDIIHKKCICLYCDQHLNFESEDLKHHALFHIKEHNLLPFI